MHHTLCTSICIYIGSRTNDTLEGKEDTIFISMFENIIHIYIQFYNSHAPTDVFHRSFYNILDSFPYGLEEVFQISFHCLFIVKMWIWYLHQVVFVAKYLWWPCKCRYGNHTAYYVMHMSQEVAKTQLSVHHRQTILDQSNDHLHCYISNWTPFVSLMSLLLWYRNTVFH